MEQRRLTIVGTGLIGGSIGLALKAAGARYKIVAHDRDRGMAAQAKKRGAADEVSSNLISAVEGSAMVVVATPLQGVREVFEKAGTDLAPGTLVTDTATAKHKVLGWAERFLPPTVQYVGGNPIVHEEGAGVGAARADLFQDATYCLVAPREADPQAVEFMAGFVRLLGAEPFFLDALEHDGQMAAVEHLPWLLSAALFRAAVRSPGWRDAARLTTGTFHRVTRFPVAEPEIYRDLCLANAQNLIRSIEGYIGELRRTQELLEGSDGEALEDLFSDPTAQRKGWMAAADEEILSPGLDEIGTGGSLGRFLGIRRPPERPPEEER